MISKYSKGHPWRRYSNGRQDEQCKSEVGRSRAEAGTETPPSDRNVKVGTFIRAGVLVVVTGPGDVMDDTDG